MIVKNKNHILNDGVTTKTLFINPTVINIETKSITRDEIKVEILDKDKVIATEYGHDITFALKDIDLWSSENPYLYTFRIQLIHHNEVIDEVIINTGIRLLEWIPQKGLFINQRKVKLKGCAIHHDNGILGAVDLYDATYRKLKLLKDFGYNAIRSAHNPCSTNVLKACDQLGLYVMDEAFDMWYLRKNRYDYGKYFEKWYAQDLTDMIKKDINHPSVVLYSIGNEVPETAQEKGIDYTRKMTTLIHKLDHTRPVTCGISLFMNMLVKQGQKIYTDWDTIDLTEKTGIKDDKTEGLANQYHKNLEKSSSEKMNEMANQLIEYSQKAPASEITDAASTPAFDILDVSGYNYATIRYEIDKNIHPKRLIVGTETTLRNYKQNWLRTIQNDNVIGDFVWAGYQYLGEAGFGAFGYMIDGSYNKESYPWLTNQTYSLDILGDISEHGALQQSIWNTLDKPFIAVKHPKYGHIDPIVNNWRLFDGVHTWTWPGYENKTTDVWVVSQAHYIDLYVNQSFVSRKATTDYIAHFKHVTYIPGSVKAVALDQDENILSEEILKTSLGPTRIHATFEKEILTANGEDLCYIQVEITDDDYITYNTSTLVSVDLKGVGTIAGIGSSNGLTTEKFDGSSFTTHFGKVLIAI